MQEQLYTVEIPNVSDPSQGIGVLNSYVKYLQTSYSNVSDPSQGRGGVNFRGEYFMKFYAKFPTLLRDERYEC